MDDRSYGNNISIGAEDLRFNSRAGQINTVSPATCLSCDVSSNFEAVVAQALTRREGPLQ